MELAKIIAIDFSKKAGKIKAVAGVHSSLLHSSSFVDSESAALFSSRPVVRLADVEYPYGKNQYLDLHCIFPDFSADETVPESYNFTETDRIVSAVRATGAEVIFRLGESLDHFERKLYAKSPADLGKWARIAEHIILHYNDGFAGGYKLKIKFWEIWNLPELSCGWCDGEESFFKLYSTVSTYLKEKFPKLKFGGYGSLGFSGLNRLDSDEVYKAAPDYSMRFLDYIKKSRAPLDFFSWYCSADTPEEVALHARYARSTLDGAGFKRTASYVVGFDLARSASGVYRGYTADLLASFITAQRGGIDMMICDMRKTGSAELACGAFDTLAAAKGAFFAFDKLYSLGGAIDTLGDSVRELYSLGAAGANIAAVAVVSREYSGKLELRLKESDFATFSVTRIYETENGDTRTLSKQNIALGGNKIAVRIEKGDVYLFEFAK